MQSFRTEIENPVVEKDIIELEKKIRLFKEGKVDEEKFRSLRLARGIYGQRQLGVQMIRIKLPYGKVTSKQLERIAKVSDEYSTGRLHITTRQDIQIHNVSLDRTPELWEELEKDAVTIREACGNTVRNVTASPSAGIDPDEPFDVTPYAEEIFKFFLRHSVGQELGRKFKISLSGTDVDDALSYLHDVGLIAKVKEENGKIIRGFKVLIAGGLGSQPRQADVLYDFLETEKIIPTIEGLLRVFDRHGNRANRNKARFKFLLKDIGLEELRTLLSQERKALSVKEYPICFIENDTKEIPTPHVEPLNISKDELTGYEEWLKTNVFPQKQTGYFAVGIKVRLGDFYTNQARSLANIIKNYAGDELRFTLRQDILIRHVQENYLPSVFHELKEIGLADLGFDTALDITACPGTDTCNLGISSSTGAALELEKIINTEYPELRYQKDLVIKISGCMNACGQHNMANIGFQGMSIKTDGKVAPALQILLGGGTIGDGQGRFADKVIKVPSKRAPEALKVLLDDFKANSNGTKFNDYYDSKGKIYFYDLLKELAETKNLIEDDFIDWGHDKAYVKAIGVGECAGVVIDLVSTLLLESKEKIALANEALFNEQWSDAIYHGYASMINTAKSLLIGENVKTNTQAKIITDFDEHFVKNGRLDLDQSFSEIIYQIKTNEPSKNFARQYIDQAEIIYKTVNYYRKNTEKNAIKN